MDTQGRGDSRDALSGVGGLAHAAWDADVATSKPKRVLLVDDNTDVLDVMSKILSRLGYDVVSGRNGIEGLTVHRENPCQFVLTDLDMPLMDGLTLARRIKTEYPLTPVVLMTGNALVERDTFHGAVRLFVDEVLYKPIRLVELRRTFRRLLP